MYSWARGGGVPMSLVPFPLVPISLAFFSGPWLVIVFLWWGRLGI